jgi:hypothetical protein
LNASERAKTLLNDEFFKELVDNQKALYISNILNSPEEDVEARERSIVKYRAVEEFIASIESIAAQKEIDKKRWKIF